MRLWLGFKGPSRRLFLLLSLMLPPRLLLRMLLPLLLRLLRRLLRPLSLRVQLPLPGSDNLLTLLQLQLQLSL